MSDATCKTCPWCRVYDHGVRHCNFNAPRPGDGADDAALWPYVNSTDWCGSHPDRQPRLECATTTIVRRETFPTESDMRRIVDALEKMANRVRRGTAV